MLFEIVREDNIVILYFELRAVTNQKSAYKKTFLTI